MKQLPLNTAYKIFGSVLFIIFVSFLFCMVQVRIEEQERQDKFDRQWNDMVDSTTHFGPCGVSVQDSIQFEIDASLALFVDLPEETPITGDHMCAFIKNDTVFIEYYHGQPYFQFLYNY